MIITIGGNLGAGKTTLTAGLLRELNNDDTATKYTELYIGGIMREMAAEQKITIEEFYKRLKYNPELEQSVDERAEKLMREKDNVIIQGRVAWFFAKGSPYKVFNLFLAVTPEVGAERSKQRPENAERSLEEITKANESRMKLEMDRYQKLYRIENFLDHAHYDFVLDTTNLNVAEVLEKVLEKIKAHG